MFGLSPEEVDCRKVRCPETPQELAEDEQVQEFAKQLWEKSEADGYQREYGAHIVRNEDGTLSMINVTKGAQGSVPNLSLAPENAIAEIHTHPGIVYPSGARVPGSPQPSHEDRVRANMAHVYGIVVAPRSLGIIPVGKNVYVVLPRR